MEHRFVPLVISGVVLSLGLALLVPLAISLLYADGSWESFLVPAAAMVVVGGLGFRTTLPRSRGGLGYVLPRDVLLSVSSPGSWPRCWAGCRSWSKAPSEAP